MKPLHNNPYSAHDDISLLLPWYVNKTLQSNELERVEKHLNVCLTCRRELASLHNLAAAVQQEGAFDSAARASFSLLKNRINKPEQIREESVSKKIVFSGQRKWYGKRWFVPRSGLALAAVLLLSVLLPRFIYTGNVEMNDYRTLSNAEKPTVDHKNTISVIFSNDTKPAQIDKILTLIAGQVSDGPNEQGLYKIAIAGEPAPKDILNIISSLRNDPNVIFVEPAYALISSVDANKDAK